MFIPPPVETPTYDLDGNQTSDARWNYAWDGENRLILAEEKPIPTAVAAEPFACPFIVPNPQCLNRL